ncbi:MAG: PH domain-containing protein [Romboutsia sp.]|nr:PH domain-containing protein [Romboutsia sp.]
MEQTIIISKLSISLKKLFQKATITVRLKDNKIEGAILKINTGFFTIRTNPVNVAYITDITIKQNLFERLFNYGDLLLRDSSKSNEGTKIVLLDIKDPHKWAETIRRLSDDLRKNRSLFIESN